MCLKLMIIADTSELLNYTYIRYSKQAQTTLKCQIKIVVVTWCVCAASRHKQSLKKTIVAICVVARCLFTLSVIRRDCKASEQSHKVGTTDVTASL